MSLQFHKELARKYHLELLGEWKLELVDEIIHQNYQISDDSAILVTSNRPLGRENFRKRILEIKQGLPDLAFELITILAEDNRVMLSWNISGTQQGTLFGFGSKNRYVKTYGTTLLIIKDNMIISADIKFDTYSLLLQLGHIKFDQENVKDVLEYLENVETMTNRAFGA